MSPTKIINDLLKDGKIIGIFLEEYQTFIIIFFQMFHFLKKCPMQDASVNNFGCSDDNMI